MATVMLILLILVVYLNIGYLWGRICWSVFAANRAKNKEEKSLLYRVCFPLPWLKDDTWMTQIDWEETRESYAYMIALVWPVKVAWNMAVGIVIAGVMCWRAISGFVIGFCEFVPTIAARLILRGNFR